MPEGDTVWRHCQALNEVLVGRALVRGELRVPQAAASNLAGRQVLEVLPRGKHQLFRLGGGLTLHTHLRMDGTWRIVPRGGSAGTRGERLPGPAHQIRVLLSTAEHQVVGLRLGAVDLIRSKDEHTVVGHLGPDLLGPDWDEAEAVRRLLSDPARTIGEALLDQRNLAGIGTLYRAETLFLAGVHPRTPVGQLGQLEELVRTARRLLTEGCGSWQQVTTGSPRAGQRHFVFDRAGRACLRCGTPIRAEEFGPLREERRSFWCPHCQPLVEDR